MARTEEVAKIVMEAAAAVVGAVEEAVPKVEAAMEQSRDEKQCRSREGDADAGDPKATAAAETPSRSR